MSRRDNSKHPRWSQACEAKRHITKLLGGKGKMANLIMRARQGLYVNPVISPLDMHRVHELTGWDYCDIRPDLFHGKGRLTVIDLPFPPSVNGLYAGKARRYKSKPYKQWIGRAMLKLSEDMYALGIEGEIGIILRLVRPDNRKRDVANYEKAVCDFLTDRRVFMDDSQIQTNTQRWDKTGTFEGVRIEITEREDGHS